MAVVSRATLCIGGLLPLLAGSEAVREEVLVSSTQMLGMETSHGAVYTANGPVTFLRAQLAQ